MPWSGTGTYTRGYASWTADATAGLPISATKFDTEDNDFAAGIQNCLTIDGQNKPNAPLTWAQALSLTRGTDGNIFAISRTGGSNNPSLTWAVADSANTVSASLATANTALSFKPSAYIFGNITDSPTFAFNGAGLTSTVTGTGQFAVTLNGAAGGQSIAAFNVNGTNYGFAGVAGAANQVVVGSALGDLVVRANTGNIWLNTNNGASINAGLTSGGVWEISDNAASPALWAAGYMDAPQNLQNGNYQFVLSDRGKSVFHNSSSAHTYTIPANASVAFPLGTGIIITNAPGGGNVTIAITSDTLTWANNGSTGSRTLGANGICILFKQFGTGWQITGPGVS